MFAGVPGWDLPWGDLKTYMPGGNVEQQPGKCAAACGRNKGCVAFKLYNNRCFLKRNSGRTARYTQAASTDEWSWLYFDSGMCRSFYALRILCAEVRGKLGLMHTVQIVDLWLLAPVPHEEAH